MSNNRFSRFTVGSSKCKQRRTVIGGDCSNWLRSKSAYSVYGRSLEWSEPANSSTLNRKTRWARWVVKCFWHFKQMKVSSQTLLINLIMEEEQAMNTFLESEIDSPPSVRGERSLIATLWFVLRRWYEITNTNIWKP